MALWGTALWAQFIWGYTPPVTYPEIPSYPYEYQPGPPPITPFVIPPEVIDPQTPLMSIRATGEFRKAYIFKIQGFHFKKPYPHKEIRQLVQKYYAIPYTRSQCQDYLRTAFAEACATWKTLDPTEQARYNAHVTHYGLTMQAKNLYISKYMKLFISSPDNPCPARRRPDRRKLRRDSGHT